MCSTFVLLVDKSLSVKSKALLFGTLMLAVCMKILGIDDAGLVKFI